MDSSTSLVQRATLAGRPIEDDDLRVAREAIADGAAALDRSLTAPPSTRRRMKS